MGTAIMYDASTGKEIGIREFVEYYSRCYYCDVSQWVESQIEKNLKKKDLEEIDFLNIFAWKTDRINQKLSEYESKFEFIFGNTSKPKWGIDKKNETATAVTQYKTFDSKELYSFFSTAKDLLKEYSDLEEQFNLGYVNLEEVNKQKNDMLNRLSKASPSGIGSVYLVTFFYFITHGDEPIYDKYAMMALDAIYPDTEQKESRLGSVVTPRELPSKGTPDFDHLLNKDWENESIYLVYKTKLTQFVKDYNTALNAFENEHNIAPENKRYPVSYASCRDIDRALWVYGHLFREKE